MDRKNEFEDVEVLSTEANQNVELLENTQNENIKYPNEEDITINTIKIEDINKNKETFNTNIEENDKIIEDDIKQKNNLKEEPGENIDISNKDKISSVTSKSFSDKFKNLKVKYKQDPKKFIVATFAILVAFSMLIGSSYAYLSYVSKTDNSTTITAGTLALNFKNESNSITLSNALPEKDNLGLENSAEYEFTIENTGSLPATYRVTLDNTCLTTKTYSINGENITPSTCIPNEFIKVAIKENNGRYKVLEKKTINNEASYIIATGSLKATKTITYKMKIWLDYDTPNTYNANGGKNIIYAGQLGLSYEQGSLGNLDNSGANAPVLDDGMVPVYYDENSSSWKKADVNNKGSNWYNYDAKKWANSVTVSSTNRDTYTNASVGTEIPMDDILTMQVWIPRYKYKVWNYNADGTKTSNEQQIEISFEDGTNTTGEISCTDSISGTDGDPSETCKLKSTNATCTDDTCNNKIYTHPAFTFGNEEIKGFWIGKFELTGTIDSITAKPNLSSIRNQSVSSFETNIMNMKNNNNQYGFSTNTDTHMIKNSEWGAVAYLSHSKYGTCTDGTCSEVSLNNSSKYTGISAGSSSSSSVSYEYNEIRNSDGTIIGEGKDGPSASTTHNIYGVYDMSGGTYEYTMGNIVSNDGSIMLSGYSSSDNSGYTGKLYDSGKYTAYTGVDYPNNKYYDKYSFSRSNTSIIRSKLGDGLKEVYKTGAIGWYSDSTLLADYGTPWFGRGSAYYDDVYAGIFNSSIDSKGAADSYASSRLIITPQSN